MKRNTLRHLALSLLAFGFVLSFLVAQQSAYAIPIDPCAKRVSSSIAEPA
jgi:hypothetical protein